MPMKSIFLFALLCIMISARPLPDDIPFSMEGTTWRYREGKKYDYKIHFLANGVVKTEHPNDFTPNNDKWHQMGKTLVFSYNDDFVTYTGTIINQNTIKGTALNTEGKRWKWKMTRLQ